ncbi:MAG: nucleotide exchange factor GrpE [Syntrophaceticus sp.]|nr:nucleotide exchange factor GrpE [Syntrophaceticus sp.]MDD4360605.1 nucleotide exchange factor GrpE [Syntrophaceticus sp.]MDD4783846.1 nucleotide exchange factor GrpE [Syntrophaceticus sp.]
MSCDKDSSDKGASAETGEETTEPVENEVLLEDEVDGNAPKDEPKDAEGSDQEKEKNYNELQHRFLRLTADFDNYRRRTREETAEIRRTANERLIQELLPIIDNFERALDAAKKELPDNLITGIEMIYRQLHMLLSQEGVEPIEAVGKPFDPVYEDAFERQETTEYPEGTVVAEIKKGYLLQGRVLRPALVIVAKEPKTEKTKSCQEGACGDE